MMRTSDEELIAYNERDREHVAALAAALGIGPLAWTHHDGYCGGFETRIACRCGKREFFIMTPSTKDRLFSSERRADDLRRLVCEVSRWLLAQVVAYPNRFPLPAKKDGDDDIF